MRGLDRVIVLLLVSFAFTSFAFDRLAALHADLEAVDSIFARFLVLYGKHVDPLVLANPLWLRIMSGISAFVMGPFYLVAAYAFLRQRNWIRGPALAYAAIMIYSMVVHLAVEFLGDLPPADTPLLLATYAPYAALPFLLIRRLHMPHPFGLPPHVH